VIVKHYSNTLQYMPWVTEHWSYLVDIKRKKCKSSRNSSNCISNEWIYFDMSIVAEAAVSFWAVIMHNLNASTNPLWIFFLQGWVQTKSRLINWIRETSSLVTLHCLRKWTSMNDQCQISLVPVHFCNSMSVCVVCVCVCVSAKSNLHISALPENPLSKSSWIPEM